MANSLIQCTGSAPTTTAAVSYNHLAGALVFDTTETNVQVITRLGGVASQLFVEVSLNANTVAPTVKTRKALADGAQVATITASTTGIFEDTTHTDTIAAGDKWNYKTTPGSANNLTITIIQLTFAATTNTLTPLVGTGTNSLYAASTTYFTELNGDYAALLVTETSTKTRVEKAGVFKNLYINVVTASASTTHALTLRDNAADSTLVATCTANTTGFFEDTTHTVTVTVGHDYNYKFLTGSTTTSLVIGSIGAELESTAGTSMLIAGDDAFSANSIFAKNTTNYNAVAGGLFSGVTTESFAQSYVRDTAFTLDKLGVMIDTNGTTVTTNSVTLRKNAADTTLLVSFTTATGLLEDTTHTVTGFAATDKLSTKIINGATAGGVHNIILCWVAYSVTGAAAAAVPLYLQPIFMEWVES